VDRVLTSGQKPKALDGRDLLTELIDQSKGRIIVMPGAGVSSKNISELMKTGATEYHGSARQIGSPFTDKDEVQTIKLLLSV